VLEADVSAAAVAAGLPQDELPDLFAAVMATQGGAPMSVFFDQVKDMTDAILDATIGAELMAAANAWRFIFLFALVVLIPFYLYSLFLPQLDRKLTNRVWARLGRGGSGTGTPIASGFIGSDKARRKESTV
jgi:hypothetical protein